MTTYPQTFGLIVPPRARNIPPEARRIYPEMGFVARGLGLVEMAHKDYDRVISDVADHAISLSTAGADAISLMGTSLSFFKGPEFNTELIETLKSVTGLPATTMSQAIIDGLTKVSAKKIAVMTAYTDAVNAMLGDYLAAYGFSVIALKALQIRNIADLPSISSETLLCECRNLLAQCNDCDALLISCGGLQTIDIAPAIEKETGIPVISSAVAGLWATVNLLGDQENRDRFGVLFNR